MVVCLAPVCEHIASLAAFQLCCNVLVCIICYSENVYADDNDEIVVISWLLS